MTRETLMLRMSFSVLTLLVSMVPQGAFARGERVMGSSTEGGQLQSSYIQKMERLDLERKQCRKDIETIIQPQLSLMDEMGLAGLPGPSKLVHEEAQFAADAQRLNQLQIELLQVGKRLNQSQNKKDDASTIRHLQTFENRMRAYTAIQRRMDSQATSLMSRSEKAVENFVPFAHAILQMKRSEACQGLWQDLRPQLPRGTEQALLNTRNRLKLQVAEVKKHHGQFAVAAARLMERFKPIRAVAADDELLQ